MVRMRTSEIMPSSTCMNLEASKPAVVVLVGGQSQLCFVYLEHFSLVVRFEEHVVRCSFGSRQPIVCGNDSELLSLTIGVFGEMRHCHADVVQLVSKVSLFSRSSADNG